MGFSISGGSVRGPQINVTPLIDVLLTLIAPRPTATQRQPSRR